MKIYFFSNSIWLRTLSKEDEKEKAEGINNTETHTCQKNSKRYWKEANMINHTNQSAIKKLQTTLQRGHNCTFQLIRMQTWLQMHIIIIALVPLSLSHMSTAEHLQQLFSLWDFTCCLELCCCPLFSSGLKQKLIEKRAYTMCWVLSLQQLKIFLLVWWQLLVICQILQTYNIYPSAPTPA